MKIKLLSLIVVLTISFGVKAQNVPPSIQWAKCYGGSGLETARCIQQTSEGGYIVAGTATSTDGDVTGCHGGGDCWIVKLTSTGKIEWQKTYGGSNGDGANYIQQTRDGGYIIAGTTTSSDGDVTGYHINAGSTLYKDYWIFKITSTGKLEWQKTLGGTSIDQAYGVVQAIDGGYVILGVTGSQDGDVVGIHSLWTDNWIIKLDSLGNMLWQNCLGGNFGENAYCIQATIDNGFIIAGASNSNDGDVSGVHLNCNYPCSSNSDYWIVKIDSLGNIQWQSAFGGSNEEEANSVQQTFDKGYIIAGYTMSHNGDVSGFHGVDDCWIIKLDSLGHLMWQKTLGGSYQEYGSCIQQTKDSGYIVACMSTSNDGDVIKHYGGVNSADYWIVKLSSLGDIEWQKTLGGMGDVDIPFSIKQTVDRGYIIGGQTTSFNGDVTGNHGQSDIWIVKLGSSTYQALPSLIIDMKDTTSCSFTVDVSVRCKNFYDISKLKGTIGWDTTYLSFGGLKFVKSDIIIDSSRIDFTNVANGKMAFNWSDTIGYSLIDSTPTFTLTFYPKKNFSGGTGVWFDSIPTKLEIDTAFGVAAKKASFNDGWVLLSDTPTIVQVGSILQCFAGCAPIHYQWYENGNPINGDTLNYITPTSGGSYTCTVTYISGARFSSLPLHVVLPVTMLNFKCYRLNEIQAKLEWQTASEINTSHFNIQRSTDGISFTTIGSVNAKGAGAYTFNDPITTHDSRFTKLYYRLQIVDKDGSKTYSDIRAVFITTDNSRFTVFPNPAKSYVTITGNNIKQVSLLDFTGRTVISKEVSNTNTINLSVNNLSKGIYLVKAILLDGSIKTEKLVVE